MHRSIEVPEEVYAKLASYADRRGQTPESLLLDYIEQIVQLDEQETRVDQESDDPIAGFIGAFKLGGGDLAENHDKFLAESYAGHSSDVATPVRGHVGLGESRRS